MARNIVIDEDTEVSYDFPTKTFYITNKGTSTHRLTEQDTKHVLDIVAPNNQISIQQLQDLATTLEPLNSVSYTWDSTGSYIATIQLNTYKENPITLNPTKHILYVMNSNVSFDLTLTEGERNRLDILQAYYKNTIGLAISLDDLRIIYRLFISYYNPHTYNIIETPTDTTTALKYSNNLALANHRGTSLATYTIVSNPTNEFTHNTIADILQLYQNQITITSPISPLTVGDKIRVANTTTTNNNVSYTCDGLYTVVKQQGTTIEVKENFPYTYIQETTPCNIVAYKSPVLSVSREERTITVDSSADLNSLLIGDTITLHGTSIETEYETITVDGTYTIVSISNNVVHIEETPLTNYTFSATEEEEYLIQPFIYKALFFGSAMNIIGNVITLTNSPTIPLQPSTNIEVNGEYLVVNTVDTTTFTTTTIPLPYAPTQAQLQQDIPLTNTMIRVETTTKPNILPTGEFILDNVEETNQYISLLPSLLTPTEEQYSNRGKYVPQEMEIQLSTVNSMKLLGLYDEVYAEEKR